MRAHVITRIYVRKKKKKKIKNLLKSEKSWQTTRKA